MRAMSEREARQGWRWGAASPTLPALGASTVKKSNSHSHRNRNKTARYRAKRKAKLRRVRLRRSSGERKTYR